MKTYTISNNGTELRFVTVAKDEAKHVGNGSEAEIRSRLTELETANAAVKAVYEHYGNMLAAIKVTVGICERALASKALANLSRFGRSVLRDWRLFGSDVAHSKFSAFRSAGSAIEGWDFLRSLAVKLGYDATVATVKRTVAPKSRSEAEAEAKAEAEELAEAEAEAKTAREASLLSPYTRAEKPPVQNFSNSARSRSRSRSEARRAKLI